MTNLFTASICLLDIANASSTISIFISSRSDSESSSIVLLFTRDESICLLILSAEIEVCPVPSMTSVLLSPYILAYTLDIKPSTVDLPDPNTPDKTAA